MFMQHMYISYNHTHQKARRCMAIIHVVFGVHEGFEHTRDSALAGMVRFAKMLRRSPTPSRALSLKLGFNLGPTPWSQHSN